MKQIFHPNLLASTAMLWLPVVVLGQNSESANSFRPYLFVLLAFAAGWVLIGAWVFQIGRKVSRLSRRIEETSGD